MLKTIILFLILSFIPLTTLTNDTEEKCMANAVYKEARGESTQGMIGVAFVIMNRIDHRLFPSSICDVIYQPRQFPWAAKKIKISDKEAFEKSVTIAKQVINKQVQDPTNGALYFSTTKITKTLTAKIGNHYFTK